MKFLAIFGIVAMLAGCVVGSPVKNKNDDSINTILMSCSSPYKLEQDCSAWSGASRSITLEGFEVRVSATMDGKVVLVMDSNYLSNAMTDIFSFNSIKHSQASNKSYYAVKKVLDNDGIKINRVRLVRSNGSIDGYVLELAGDGYTALKKHTTL